MKGRRARNRMKEGEREAWSFNMLERMMQQAPSLAHALFLSLSLSLSSRRRHASRAMKLRQASLFRSSQAVTYLVRLVDKLRYPPAPIGFSGLR